jgi:two-component system osmolarity sensor histidine kinase EnvZ
MFYGLNKFIKNILPKRLFYRGLLIVAVPIIILQIVVTIVFFDSLWIKTNKGMTRALVSEINTFIIAYDKEDNKDTDKKYLVDLFSLYLDLNIKFIENKIFTFQNEERWFSPIDRSLRRELKSKMGNKQYWFNTTSYKELINIRIKYQKGYFEFLVPKDRVTNSSARLFALWITVPAILLITIAMIFLKNQTRPITRLAKAAEKFGRGENIDEFRPSGSLEIRQAGYEFDKMRKRIIRHLNQRSEMLSGISHDLRTPLTRMKLQLAFIKDNDLSKKLAEDINEMEKMLNEYLQFTSSTHSEKNELFNLTELINKIIDRYNNKNISRNLIKEIYINGRKNLLKRCLNNLIDNSIKYAQKINIVLNKNSNSLFINIEDDGPGISSDEYENVFKPFYKIDRGRGDSKSSVGLGLSIASDIIRSHGGNIKLDRSSMNGLTVKIFLPA